MVKKKVRYFRVMMDDNLFGDSRKKAIDMGLSGVKNLIPKALEDYLKKYPVNKDEGNT